LGEYAADILTPTPIRPYEVGAYCGARNLACRVHTRVNVFGTGQECVRMSANTARKRECVRHVMLELIRSEPTLQ